VPPTHSASEKRMTWDATSSKARKSNGFRGLSFAP
jgi:hypothetical protein